MRRSWLPERHSNNHMILHVSHDPIMQVGHCGLVTRLSRVGRKNKAWNTLCSDPPVFLEICSRLYKMPATDHNLCGQWQLSDERIQLFTCRNLPCTHPFAKHCGMWCNLSLWNSLITSYKTPLSSNDVVSDFKTVWMCLKEMITRQFGLQAG